MKNNLKSGKTRVKYIDGNWRYFKKCVGYCNNNIHKGFLTPKLYDQHKCFEKNCSFFDGRENHPYILMKKEKQNAKKRKKETRNNEREIIKFANDVLPNNIKTIFCKHLYDSTFLLVLHSISWCNCDELFKKMQFDIYVKFIHERQVANIKYTYESLLPEDMKAKAKKCKEKR